MHRSDQAATEARAGPLQVRDWPLVDQKRVSGPAAIGIIATGLALAHATGSRVLGFFSAVALILATWRLWVPVVFIVRPEGLVERVLGRSFVHPWRDVVAMERAGEGIVVTLGPAPGRASPVARIYIHSRSQTERLLEQIRAWVPAAAAATEPAAGGDRPG